MVSYIMMAKPMKTLGLHCPMMPFLKMTNTWMQCREWEDKQTCPIYIAFFGGLGHQHTKVALEAAISPFQYDPTEPSQSIMSSVSIALCVWWGRSILAWQSLGKQRPSKTSLGKSYNNKIIHFLIGLAWYKWHNNSVGGLTSCIVIV